MTPLAAASSAPPAPAPGARAGKAAAGAGEGDAFARALERRQGPRAGADAARTRAPDETAADATTPEAALESGTLPGADDRPDQDTVESPATVVVDAQPPAPVWPPAGLAALLGFPAEAAPAAAPVLDDPEADLRPLPLGGASSPAAMPMPAAAPAAAIALPEAALPDADAALPMPALAVDTAAPVEGGEPTPVAFALPATAALREPAPMLAAPLPAPAVGAEDFEARFGAQIEWMAGQKIGHARIRVTPNDLGPVEVRLHMDGDRIRAEFVAPQAETRQALEQGLPRLRDLLGEHGFQLAHAGVGNGHAGGGEAGAGNPSPDEGPAGSAQGGPETGMSSPPTVQRTLGLLDAYA
ncbi:flagellar hook-length control protein FliK [Luteimonas sp. XNQY3]|nr:flagellar hook-length control protein FliK [Luteimonas sp. XNQY3]MCD9008154.1 flagellar hook-length control protein FliK [Luteimonas sp. XNQY3]